MKNKTLSLFLLLAFLNAFNLTAQDRTMLVFDLVNGSLDSITNIQVDTTNQIDNTPHFIGNFDSNVEVLEQEPPTMNIYPNTSFTLKRQASLDHNINNYPIRTSVKISYIENGALNNLCSGSLVSRRHILTAAHCISEINTNILLLDSLVVCPIYDNGIPNDNFACSDVTKAYLIKDWVLGGEDFAILELEESIGESIGWIGFGFDNTNNQFTDDIFYKFTYPSIYIPQVDSNEYNGDTLYYNYGIADMLDDYFIGVHNTNGIVGESGSSLIRVVNNELYISHGVLTFSSLRHSKINREIFYLLKQVIQDDIVLNDVDLDQEVNVSIFPIPTTGIFQVENLPENESVNIYISDPLGRTVYAKNNYESGHEINISNLPSGHYFLMIKMGQAFKVEKIIKG